MKKKQYKWLPIIIFSVALLSFTMSIKKENNYNFENPRDIIILPKILHEISGLTDFGTTSIASIQDELGIVFIYDLRKQEITSQIQFAEDGDYEGITKVHNSIFVLRSDGLLFKIKPIEDKNPEVTIFETSIPAKDNESLCYDEKNNRLLIGSKVKSGKGSSNEIRHIYAFDLNANKINQTPAFTLKKQEVISFAKKNNINLPIKYKKKDKTQITDLKLGVSGISVHPKTNDLYVLSAIDYLILVYNQSGELKNMMNLNKKKFPQAEGITFYNNGDLLISNEGRDGQPTLMRFEYTRSK